MSKEEKREKKRKWEKSELLQIMTKFVWSPTKCLTLLLSPWFTIVMIAAACMTLGLAEFGKPFITSIINDSDIVPTLSAYSIHDFISEVLKLAS